MATATFNQQLNSKHLEFLKYSILLYMITDIMALLNLFSQIGYLQIILSLFFNVLLFISIINFYRHYPDAFPNLKILLVIVVNLGLILTSILISYLYSAPAIASEVTLQMVNNSEAFFQNFYLIVIINITMVVAWILFAYYFTVFINKNFSGSKDKIRIFLGASFVSALGELFLLYGYYRLNFVFDSIQKNGITSANTTAYQQVFTIFSNGYLILLTYCIIELIACWRIYSRINQLSKGTYNPRRQYNPNEAFFNITYETPNTINENQNDNESRYCPYCGNNLLYPATFCENCGKIIEYEKSN